MKLPPFSIHRPRSVTEASSLLADMGDEAVAYCGGTELLLAMKFGLANYAHLVDLKRVDGLHGIAADNGSLRIGAATTHYEVESSGLIRSWCPELAAMSSQVANLRVRSVGTLGGNLCFADPHSDPVTFLIAVGATLLCQKEDDIRRVPVGQFVTGPYQTLLEPGELLAAVELPTLPSGTGVAHARMKLHERPTVTVTAMLQLTRGAVAQARLAIGSVSAVPLSAEAAESLLGATAADFAARAEACAEQTALTCTPLPDGDCSPDYLRHLVHVHCRQALTEAFRTASIRLSTYSIGIDILLATKRVPGHDRGALGEHGV
jgi:aerobic carbon-monoxide dehydrogenase medium subunit